MGAAVDGVRERTKMASCLVTEDPSGGPDLQGGVCRACGYTFFPFQSYGCERCGATDIDEREIVPRGRLVAWATVYIHPDSRRPAPFTVGEVALDAGPAVRALLDESVDVAALKPGQPVEGCLAPAADDEDEAFRFRFRLAGESA